MTPSPYRHPRASSRSDGRSGDARDADPRGGRAQLRGAPDRGLDSGREVGRVEDRDRADRSVGLDVGVAGRPTVAHDRVRVEVGHRAPELVILGAGDVERRAVDGGEDVRGRQPRHQRAGIARHRRSRDLQQRVLGEHPEPAVERVGDGVAGVGPDRQQAAGSRGRQGPPDDLGPEPARLVGRADVQRSEVPDVLALDRDAEPDDLAVDLAEPEAVGVVAQGAAPKRKEALAGLRRSRAGRPAAGSREILHRLADHGIGRPEICRRRTSDDDPIESIDLRHVGHPASMMRGRPGPRVATGIAGIAARRRDACRIVGSTDGWRS